jgi:hypothetical protein
VLGTLERTMAPPTNRVRAGLGLAPVGGAGELFGRAPLLYMTAEPFEYPRSDWPDNVVLIGPCDWDPPADPAPMAGGHRPADRAGRHLLGVPGRHPPGAGGTRRAGQ